MTTGRAAASTAVLALALAIGGCGGSSDRSGGDGVSTYPPLNGGMEANMQGTLALLHGCLGLQNGDTFSRIALPEGSFRFDGHQLVFRGRTITLGSTFQDAGGSIQSNNVAMTPGLRLADGCDSASQIAMITPNP